MPGNDEAAQSNWTAYSLVSRSDTNVTTIIDMMDADDVTPMFTQSSKFWNRVL